MQPELAQRRSSNWHLPVVLERARKAYQARHLVSIPESTTLYAAFLRQQTQAAVQALLAEETKLNRQVQAVYISGPVAYGTAQPFYPWAEGKTLPPRTLNLVCALYTWLFAALARSTELDGSRFLDPILTEVLKLCFILKGATAKKEAPELAEAIQRRFAAACNFSPPVACRLTLEDKAQAEHLLGGYFIIGFDWMIQRLAIGSEDELRNRQDLQAAACVIVAELSSPRHLAGLRHPPSLEAASQTFENYLRLRDGSLTTVCLDPTASQDGAGWREKNALFFELLKAGRYQSILVRDVTKRLDDSKDAQEQNEFTILKVEGLKADQGFIPAYEIVFKLRGLAHHRGAANHRADLIKEFLSYAYLHEKISRASPSLLATGPLLLTCERLELPCEPADKLRWIGFFMQEINPPTGSRILTCRAHHVTDVWALNASVRTVLTAAREYKLDPDPEQVRAWLLALSTELWSHGCSVDYCDLVWFFNASHQIVGLRLVDLERLSFGELVGEHHPLLETLIDLKTRLRKGTWDQVVPAVYTTGPHLDRLETLSDVRRHLLPVSKKRTLLLATLHGLKRVSARFGPRLERRFWAGITRVLALVGGEA